MSVVSGLTREGSSTISFVIACLFCEAIDLDDLREWALHVVISNEVDDIPDYILDLTDRAESRADVVMTMGFSVGDSRTSVMEPALYGIAYMRGSDVYDPPVSRAVAELELQRNPAVLREFRDTFPFISLGDS